ncbi:MAG: hypothetical protein JRI25_08100 [Deltaproteobacteria bacterium]|nr:hypothetical protein [Deltaproteobacteria bacterium]MBW2254546.1 hypothetical protein [Deltaproteobacteria bacterium]
MGSKLLSASALWFAWVSAAGASPGPMVDVCHYPTDDPDGFHTIRVNESAAQAHLVNHPSDFLGECCFEATDCDDGDACTADSCARGQCAVGPVDCDDSDLCTDNACDPSTGCTNDEVDCADPSNAPICDAWTHECETSVHYVEEPEDLPTYSAVCRKRSVAVADRADATGGPSARLSAHGADAPRARPVEVARSMDCMGAVALPCLRRRVAPL